MKDRRMNLMVVIKKREKRFSLLQPPLNFTSCFNPHLRIGEFNYLLSKNKMLEINIMLHISSPHLHFVR